MIDLCINYLHNHVHLLVNSVHNYFDLLTFVPVTYPIPTSAGRYCNVELINKIAVVALFIKSVYMELYVQMCLTQWVA
jgi:hypothetical protein